MAAGTVAIHRFEPNPNHTVTCPVRLITQTLLLVVSASTSRHLDLGLSNVGNGRSLQTNEVLPVDIIPCPIFLCKSHLDLFQFRTLSHPFYFLGFTPQNNALSYLSPDFGGVLQPRRALSGGGGSRLASRQSRSENSRSGVLGPPPHPGSSFPSFPSSRHVDFLSQPRESRFLYPLGAPPFSRHHLRASSG